MSENDTRQIVNKAWSFAHLLRDDGLSYMAYTEQITFLLFLKMAHQRTQPPWRRPPIVPDGLDWPSLLVRDGEELETHYRRILSELPKQGGMLGEIFKKARQEIQNPATLKRLIVDLIDREDWMSMHADVKGDIYEGLLAKSAQESPKGAGQYFTPRELIKAIVDCTRPGPEDTVCDPACGTGGFLLAAHEYVVREHGSTLDPDQKHHLRQDFVRGWEIVPATARLCIMNLYLHGISPDESPIQSGVDSLANDPGDRFSMVLTNPPFGKKSSIRIVNEEGKPESHSYERQDFWTSTKNKQLNFLQHVKTLLRMHGSCAIVVPDNVLVRGRRRRDRTAQPAPAIRCPHASAASDRDLLCPGSEGQRPVLRRQARAGEALDRAALGVRPAHEQALHAQDEAAPARGSRRLRRMLPAGRTPQEEADVEPGERGWALESVRIRRIGEARQAEPGPPVAPGQCSGGHR